VFYVKRLIGLPGERIRIADGRVYADGRLLGEADGIPEITYTLPVAPSWARRDGEDFVIGPDEYFVLGDNTPNSYDSRYWGCIPSAAICGKVTLIYYPFARFGRVASATVKPSKALVLTAEAALSSLLYATQPAIPSPRSPPGG